MNYDIDMEDVGFKVMLSKLLDKLKAGEDVEQEMESIRNKWLHSSLKHIIRYFLLEGNSVSGLIKFDDDFEELTGLRIILFSAALDIDLAQKLHDHIMEWTKDNINPIIEQREKEKEQNVI